jgi:hypothetical protein
MAQTPEKATAVISRGNTPRRTAFHSLQEWYYRRQGYEPVAPTDRKTLDMGVKVAYGGTVALRDAELAIYLSGNQQVAVYRRIAGEGNKQRKSSAEYLVRRSKLLRRPYVQRLLVHNKIAYATGFIDARGVGVGDAIVQGEENVLQIKSAKVGNVNTKGELRVKTAKRIYAAGGIVHGKRFQEVDVESGGFVFANSVDKLLAAGTPGNVAYARIGTNRSARKEVVRSHIRAYGHTHIDINGSVKALHAYGDRESNLVITSRPIRDIDDSENSVKLIERRRR